MERGTDKVEELVKTTYLNIVCVCVCVCVSEWVSEWASVCTIESEISEMITEWSELYIV